MPASRRAPSLALFNARVLTMDRRQPRAQAVALDAGRICAVGSNATVREQAGPGTETIDCGGALLVPGLIDAHAHLLAQAVALQQVDCSPVGTASIEQLVQRLRTAAERLPEGVWLRGRGYHEATVEERRHPTRRDLDRAAPNRPLRLIHASGHASVLNSIALALAGIDSGSEEPPGGTIDRELGTGEPSGLLIEMEDVLDRLLPEPDPAATESLLARLSERLLAAGVTSVQDLGHRNDRRRAEFLSGLVRSGRFRPRLTLATGYDAFASGECAEADGISRGPIKIMLNETGESLRPAVAELTERLQRIQRAGRQAAIHAVEARAITAALAAIETAQQESGSTERRHRIEHASLTPPTLACDIAARGAVVVSNPAFLFAHGDRYLQMVPEKELPALYNVAGLLRAGAHVAAGSDCPLAPPEPLLGIVAVQGRRTRGGARVPGEGIGLQAALSLYTATAAYAVCEDRQKGRLRPGLFADLVLLGGPADNLKPRMTILGGQIVWQERA